MLPSPALVRFGQLHPQTLFFKQQGQQPVAVTVGQDVLTLYGSRPFVMTAELEGRDERLEHFKITTRELFPGGGQSPQKSFLVTRSVNGSDQQPSFLTEQFFLDLPGVRDKMHAKPGETTVFDDALTLVDRFREAETQGRFLDIKEGQDTEAVVKP